MSPRAIVQLMVTGSRILAKAFLEAGRQAVKNAKHRPQGGVGDATGVTTARSGSVTDRLTREHLMTLDEAHLILNVKRGEPVEKIIRHYEHLFRANGPPAAESAKAAEGAAPQNSKFFTGRGAGPRYHSAYIQSKVVRARERIEAEAKLASETEAAPAEEAASSESSSSPPPPPPPSTPPS